MKLWQTRKGHRTGKRGLISSGLVQRAHHQSQQVGQILYGEHDTALQGVQGAVGRLPYLDTIQLAFGDFDISSVRVRIGGEAATASDNLGAIAYTTGDTIGFRIHPDLHTAAHEAAHVVQQRQGVQLRREVGEKNDPYERHADAVADLVVQGRSAENLLGQMPGPGSAVCTQRQVVQKNGGGDEEDDVVVTDVPGGSFFMLLLDDWKEQVDNAIQNWTADQRASEAEWSAFSSSVIGGLIGILGIGLSGPAAAGLVVTQAVIDILRNVPSEEDPIAKFREGMLQAYEDVYDGRLNSGPRIVRSALGGEEDLTSGERARRIALHCFRDIIENIGEGETPNIQEQELRNRVTRHLDWQWQRRSRRVVVGLPMPPRQSTAMDVILGYQRTIGYLTDVEQILVDRVLSGAERQRLQRSLLSIARGNDVGRLPGDMRADVLGRIRDLLQALQQSARRGRTRGGSNPPR